MNLPNKLSIVRVSCVPFIIFLLYQSAEWCRWAAVGLFAFAAFTDFLDGQIARKNNLVTDFGKFIDPIADKLLVLSTMIMLTELDRLPAWLVILILARELSVDGLRLIAGTKGKVIAAGPLGKIKTVSQIALILFLLISGTSAFSSVAGTILCIWTGVITLWSAVDYFFRNSAVFS